MAAKKTAGAGGQANTGSGEGGGQQSPGGAGNEGGEGGGQQSPGGAGNEGGEGGEGAEQKKLEALAGELKSCDLRPTAEEMFGRFMVSVAGRAMAVHQPASEIADTAERLTNEWLSRKDKFAGK